MTTTCVHEHSSSHIYERDLARRWYALAPGTRLPLSDGSSCALLFAGLPGSSAGPDVQDAILAFPDQRTGAVEFHVYASDWHTHRHHLDARYNNVILHVVLICDTVIPLLRQDGTAIPTCSLNDLGAPSRNSEQASWPCQHIMSHMSNTERSHLLRRAGLLRFEQKAHTFVEQIHDGQARAPFSLYDASLILALAEGLGYGRDRAVFRSAGARLLGLPETLPEPLGHTAQPARLDAGRLASLRKLVDMWRVDGAWNTFRTLLETIHHSVGAGVDVVGGGDACVARLAQPGYDPALASSSQERDGRRKRPNPTSTSSPAPTENLRALFSKVDISESRADILICNVVLPFAYAVGLVENDSLLCEKAQSLYQDYPDLPSNRITRAMMQQLQLASEPSGACRQQGLHYIYQQTCREKRCEECIAGRRAL